jgi:Mrp family chromosome partitioning ATPase
VEPLGWYLLPAGEARSNPTDLLQTPALAGVMGSLVPRFDWILIDSPPIIPLTDALSLRQQATASLLVVRAGSTPDEAVENAIALLGKQHLFGVVLNAVDGLERLYSKYGYYGRNATRTDAEGER